MFRAGQRRPTDRLHRPTRRKTRLCVEFMESRRLLSTAVSGPLITPSVSVTADRHGWGFGGFTPVGITNPTPYPTALTPAQVAGAYSISQSPTSGAGQTIAVVDVGNDPNIQSDLAAFSAQYGLPAANLTVVNQNGQTGNLPATDPNWSLETAMDVEWAHAAAPGAKIVLVEANSANLSDLMTAVQTGAGMASVVSMSWGGSEFQGETAYDSTFANPKVTFVAASGDSGGQGGAQWPAVSPYVVGVGGTTLSPNSTETAWSASSSWYSGASGSGGGVSQYESVPSYQRGVPGASTTNRTTPDVAAVGNPSTGLSVYDTVPGTGQTGWFQVGGTSAGAPIWSGIVAAADAGRSTPLNSTQTLSLLYTLAGNPTTYAATFHDVTSGANFAGSAAKGYDMVTGLGSPIASTFVAVAATPAKVTPSSHAAATTTVVTPAAKATTPTTTTPTITQNDVVFVVTVTLNPLTITSTPLFVTVNPPPFATQTAPTPSPTTQPVLIPSVAAQPARPVQSLSGAVRSVTSSNDSGTHTTHSQWWLEPNDYSEPAVPEAPAAALGPDELLAFGMQSLTAPLWTGPDVADLAREILGAAPSYAAEPDPTPLPPPDAPEVNPSWVLGTAVAAWGLWEYRSRKADRERRRPFAWPGPALF